MNTYFQAVLIFLISLLLHSNAIAEQASFDLNNQKIVETWNSLHIQLNTDYRSSNIDFLVATLQTLGEQNGYASFDRYAKELNNLAKSKYTENDVQAASKILSVSNQLALNSLENIVHSFNLRLRLFGLSPTLQALTNTIMSTTTQISTLLILFKKALYPLLWVATISLLIVMFTAITVNYALILRRFLVFLPPFQKAIVGPLLLLLLFVTPLFFGPLFTLVIWSILILALLAEGRTLVVFSGICLLSWAVLVPIREYLNDLLSKQHVKLLLAQYDHKFIADKDDYLDFATKDEIFAGVAWYYKAQRHIAKIEYDLASHALNRAKTYFPNDSWLELEQARLLFLEGNIEDAHSIFEKQFSNGNKSVELLYNLSLLKFDRLDISGGTSLLAQARKKDEALVDRLETLKNRNPETPQVASASIPTTLIIKTIFGNIDWHSAQTNQVLSKLMPVINSLMLKFTAVILILMGFTLNLTHKNRAHVYFKDYQAGKLLHIIYSLPVSLMVRHMQYAKAVLCTFCITLIVLPILLWPADLVSLNALNTITPLYISAVAIILFGLTYFSYIKQRSIK